jgi:hypothetical protein
MVAIDRQAPVHLVETKSDAATGVASRPAVSSPRAANVSHCSSPCRQQKPEGDRMARREAT